MSDIKSFNTDLLQFLQRSPTPFHAVSNLVQELEAAGYRRLDERDPWQVKPGGRYYVTRNGSSLIAFMLGRHSPAESGWRMVGAHTDSPCLKVKPQPETVSQGCWQLGVEVYGGALLNPWFDRSLSLAGRVTCRHADGRLVSELIDFIRPLAVIPSLAIHLDREANSQRSINAQQHLPPVLKTLDGNEQMPDLRQLLRSHLEATRGDEFATAEVLDYELSFYDVEAPALVGWKQDFIASARLDNLLSCFIGVRALLAADGDYSCLLVCNDHEEVGSQSSAGAQGPMLRAVLDRLAGSTEAGVQIMSQSLLVSCDNAHAIHPNYADRHDARHGPLLNGGPVIKLNANQRYATNSETSAWFRHFCSEAGVPVQSFVVRSDMACGSTIGPITASAVGVPTVDVGVPQLAMHSIRELCGVQDPHRLYRALIALNNAPQVSIS